MRNAVLKLRRDGASAISVTYTWSQNFFQGSYEIWAPSKYFVSVFVLLLEQKRIEVMSFGFFVYHIQLDCLVAFWFIRISWLS